MRVLVDFDMCDSNGLCVLAAPKIFQLDGDDELHILQERPDEELWPAAEEAGRACPKLAITLLDEH